MPDYNYNSPSRLGQSSGAQGLGRATKVNQDLVLDPEEIHETIGNQATVDLLREHMANANDQTEDVGAIWEAAAAAHRQGTGQTMETPEFNMPSMADGTWYTVTARDMEGMMTEEDRWERIGDCHAIHEDHLMAFNQQVRTVDQGDGNDHIEKLSPILATGVKLYIPSHDELLLTECRHKAGDLNGGISLYKELKGSQQDKVLETARERGSGARGMGYSNKGDGGIFYSPNPELVGASSKRTKEMEGQTEYKVNWGALFWKCSIFMNDVAYSAGFKPAMRDNGHYELAGRVEQSDAYEELPVAEAKPGHFWQRDGGNKADDSHNGVLSSFVEVENLDHEHDLWTFKMIGAEMDQVAESKREKLMKKGTNVTAEGKVIRFFQATTKR